MPTLAGYFMFPSELIYRSILESWKVFLIKKALLVTLNYWQIKRISLLMKTWPYHYCWHCSEYKKVYYLNGTFMYERPSYQCSQLYHNWQRSNETFEMSSRLVVKTVNFDFGNVAISNKSTFLSTLMTFLNWKKILLNGLSW